MNKFKKLHSQCFTDDFKALWPVLKQLRKSEKHAFCMACCEDFYVAHDMNSNMNSSAYSKQIAYAECKNETK